MICEAAYLKGAVIMLAPIVLACCSALASEFFRTKNQKSNGVSNETD
jgi:hypothetical protein